MRSVLRVERSNGFICEWFGLRRLTECKGIFIAGLRGEQGKANSDELFVRDEPNIRHYYYDDVFNALCHAHLGGDDTPQSGMALIVRVAIAKDQVHKRPTLVAWGASEGPKLELFVERDRLVLQHTDAAGRPTRVFCAYTPDTVLTVRVEAGLSDDGFWMLLNVNNQPVQSLTAHEKLEAVDLTAARGTLGCALDGSNNAKFRLFEKMLCGNSLTIVQRLQVWKWNRERANNPEHLYFDGTASMNLG